MIRRIKIQQEVDSESDFVDESGTSERSCAGIVKQTYELVNELTFVFYQFR